MGAESHRSRLLRFSPSCLSSSVPAPDLRYRLQYFVGQQRQMLRTSWTGEVPVCHRLWGGYHHSGGSPSQWGVTISSPCFLPQRKEADCPAMPKACTCTQDSKGPPGPPGPPVSRPQTQSQMWQMSCDSAVLFLLTGSTSQPGPESK